MILKDKGTNSGEDKDDEDEAPKKRLVSPYVLIHRVTSIMIYEARSEQPKEKYCDFFCKLNLMKNDESHLVQYLLIRCLEHTKLVNSWSNFVI